LIYSYTSISCYKNCPRQFYHRYIVKDLPFVPSPQLDWGNRVHKAMEERLKNRLPLPPDLVEDFEPLALAVAMAPRVAIESQLYITRDLKPSSYRSKDAFLSAKGDVLTFNREYTTAFAIDWKTGRVREDPAQLAILALVMAVHYPDVQNVSASYYWIQERRVGASHEVTNLIQSTYNEVCQLADLIAIQEQDGEQAFQATPGEKFPCPYCAVRGCKAREGTPPGG
jgi:hypothetical protein